MSKMVTIYIDDKEYQVPAGTNVVDVAKFYADNDIPVFCYHPKMAPVGMCRMCLVEMGNVEKDRQTGEILHDENGNPKIRWFPKLQTACTQTVSDGLAIRTHTKEVTVARDDIIEFILTSHPLDCPICDKGGECPLQNLTMRHGAGESRFNFDDKMKLDKHVPLGELIYLDRERCIQCARCTRFCDEVAGDEVLAFHERGRALQIVTISDPPFDSKFSGNTTDICPVGALTTADFRFGARPWELKDIPSLDPYGPEGTNISFSTRLDRDAGGIVVIKRVMPRQNEHVNEIWISDKTRFGHHHTRATDRLKKPLVRKGNKLVESTWEEALTLVAEKLKSATTFGAIAGPALSNEDLWELRQLVQAAGSNTLGVYPATMSGSELVAQVGVARGTNFSAYLDATTNDLYAGMGKGTVILVIASDLEEEAPIWWLRAKQAGDRGATIITLNARHTTMDYKRREIRYAKHSLRYAYGDAANAVNSLLAQLIHDGKTSANGPARTDGFEALQKALKKEKPRDGYEKAVEAIAAAENLVIFCGAEGLTLEQHHELMQACANLLIVTGHVGKANNGLIPVWQGANIQGAFDMGYRAETTHAILQMPPDVLLIAGCNPVGEASEFSALKEAKFVVVTSQFESQTTAIADVVLPQQSFAERDGTFTSGERRVQRFYPGQGVIGESLPDWKIFGLLRSRVDGSRPKLSAALVMTEITKSVEAYTEMGYKNLAQREIQFPDVGGEDLYYGGTAYQNEGGVGIQWAVTAENPQVKLTVRPVTAKSPKRDGDLLIVPTIRLYDRGMLFVRSELMHGRIAEPLALVNSDEAAKHGLGIGDWVNITADGTQFTARVMLDGSVPRGVVLVPRCLNSVPTPFTPTVGQIEKALEAIAVP